MRASENIFTPDAWYREGGGARYRQFYRAVADAVRSGRLEAGDALPPERRLAEIADVSRVTVRRAMAMLARDGLVEQRQGAGSFVSSSPGTRLEQSLSSLVSFTENLRSRGYTSSSEVLSRGLYAARTDEVFALGLSPAQQVARIRRLRMADGTPMAIETSALPSDILPEPEIMGASLYAHLRERGLAPVRAIQRITARNLNSEEAGQLKMRVGVAVLQIDRTAFLPSGRPIEFTRGIYHTDFYDFVSELRLDQGA